MSTISGTLTIKIITSKMDPKAEKSMKVDSFELSSVAVNINSKMIDYGSCKVATT